MLNTRPNIRQPGKETIIGCQKGDKNSFRLLFNLMHTYAYNLSYRILLNKHDAMDAVQESFVKIWQNIHRYKPRHLFSTWMYKIVVNTCLDSLKSKK